MVEAVFSASAQGSLKIAQHFGEGRYSGGAVGVFLSRPDGRKPGRWELAAARKRAERARRREWEQARPMGGSAGDVLGFSLGLSVGDISEAVPGSARRAALEAMCAWRPTPERQERISRELEAAEASLEILLRRWRAGEAVRLWYSGQPEELCGFYWLLEKLAGEEGACGPVSMVMLPRFTQREDGTVVEHNGWGEVSPGRWGHYLGLEQPVSPALRRACGARWRTLREENAPLRAVLNGRLSSVPADFYDGFIRRALAEEDGAFSEAQLIGRILGQYQLGIGDGLIASRLQAMADAGELEVLTQPPPDGPLYQRTLRKRQ